MTMGTYVYGKWIGWGRPVPGTSMQDDRHTPCAFAALFLGVTMRVMHITWRKPEKGCIAGRSLFLHGVIDPGRRG